jgi:hypothetical protein
MFQRLHYILIFVVFTIFIFFVVSSFAFSGRLAEGQLNSFSVCSNLRKLMDHLTPPRFRSQAMESPVVAS